MTGKRPSSLDYEAYVDELAVSSFRRALVARRFDRARQSVERLVESPDRMWRWVGCQNLATLHLALGLPGEALEALEEAERLYPDVPGLVRVTRCAAVQILLDAGEPEAALHRADEGSFGAALALLGMGHRGDAEAIARRLETEAPAQASLIFWEAASGGSEGLERIFASLRERDRNARLRFRLARCLEAEERVDEAASVYATITASPEDLLDHAVPTVRSHFRLGQIESTRDAARARASFSSYLAFWERGEMDRDDVSRATAWLNA